MRILALVFVGNRGWLTHEIRTAWSVWRTVRQQSRQLRKIERGLTLEETFDRDLQQP